MGTIYYEARRDYQGVRDGRVLGPWRTGDPVTPQRGDLAWLHRDSPGLFDITKPLTHEQVTALRGVREQAERDAREREAARVKALQDHVRRLNGAWCLGRPSVPSHLTHELQAEQHGDDWRVACPPCMRWHSKSDHSA